MAPREVDGCAKPWKRAGAEVQKFGVWPLGPQPVERGVFGLNKGVACGARETVTNPARPMAPAVPSVTNTEAPSGGEVGQHPGITRIPPPLGTVAPVKPGVFPTWGTCIAGDQL